MKEYLRIIAGFKSLLLFGTVLNSGGATTNKHYLFTEILRKCFHSLLLLFLIYPHHIRAGKHSELFDMTGDMPGVRKVGADYFSKLCRSKPMRMLEEHQSRGHNIRECLKNTTKRCPSIRVKSLEKEYIGAHRRVLLKRIPLKDRKRREQGWLSGHPNQQDYELIEMHVLSSRKNCFFISRDCLQSGLSFIKLYEHESDFPFFESRSWGSCALVGLSDQLLVREYGEDIDAHDVVIRMGHLPLNKYKKSVGSRSDVIIYRPGSLKRDQKGHRPMDVKAYLCKNPFQVKDQSTEKTSFKVVKDDTGNIYCDRVRGKNDFALSLLDQLYENMAPGKKPTSGTIYALRLAFSRLCGRLDIYGISSGGGGTYFEPEAVTKAKHGTELDSWLLHYLMKNYDEELHTCIYS